MPEKDAAVVAAVAKGLEGVIAAATSISSIDGTAGRLTYRGIPIEDLAANSFYEEVAYFLWNGQLPTRTQLEQFMADLALMRKLPDNIVAALKIFPTTSSGMDMLRTVISLLSVSDPEEENNSPGANRRKALRLMALFPSIIAGFHRVRNGLDIIAPNPTLGHAENFLYMLTGAKPDPVRVKGVDLYLVLLADHGLNASTFTARVIAGTEADMYAAVTGALGALKGPLHGGANQGVMDMLDEIGSLAHVDAWFDATMSGHRRIMGMGHRVYKTEDPRARVLRRVSDEMGHAVGQHDLHEMALRIEQRAIAHPHFLERKLAPNVDYYSATVLYYAGIPLDLFTTIFAMSRIVGWTAHLIEQYADNRLIRPRAQYIGPDYQPYVPMAERTTEKLAEVAQSLHMASSQS
ncbi:MAG: citrate/2-methylcitrate synthase [Anaerolineae bacterium]|nr:citrate synthase [Anaerolineae bacterium]